MSINTQQENSKVLDEKPQSDSNKVLLLSKIPKPSQSPQILKNSKSQAILNIHNKNNQLQTSMISLNKSNSNFHKVIVNKKNYDQFIFQKKYLISKTQYHKLISNLSDVEKKIKENNDIIDNLNKNLNTLKETKKKKKEEITELLSSQESLEEIYQNKIASLSENSEKLVKDKNDKINGQNNNNGNNNDNGEEQTNPNTNDSNNSNEENKNNENDGGNNNHKNKSNSMSSLLSSDSDNNAIEIKYNEIKLSNQKRYEEQVNSLVEGLLHKKDYELKNKIKADVKEAYQAFSSDANSENEMQNSVCNFFTKISSFISSSNIGNISEKQVNIFLHDLMKINYIETVIEEILKFLNKTYKERKTELKGQLRTFSEKNEILEMKKKSFETKKEELKSFMDEYKEKYINEKNKNDITDNEKAQYTSFISENDNLKNEKMLFINRNGFKKHSVKIKKLKFGSLNNSENKIRGLDINNNDLNKSSDIIPNSDRQIIDDSFNKYLIDCLKINSKNKAEKSIDNGNKKIILQKFSNKNSGIGINELLNNNICNNTEIDPKINESKINLMNNTEILGDSAKSTNKKRIKMRIIYRNSKNKNMNSRNKTNVIPINNNSNLQDLISAKKNPSTNKIIFLKKNKSNSFRNIHELKSPAKITTTHRHNHIYFQREEVKEKLFSRSPDGNLNNTCTNKTNNIPYQGKIISLNKTNIEPKKIDLTKINKSGVYSTRYDNRLKILTKGIKESFCYFKFYKDNFVEFSPLDEYLKTPENLDYIEGYISIDVLWHQFKLKPKIYKNQITNYEQLVNNLDKDINISELNSNIENNDYLGIELKDIIDIILSKEMKDILKIYNAYSKFGERQEKPNINKFINSREVRNITLDQNDKMKSTMCKYFTFSLKFKKESVPKIEFIFINYEQFNLWYNCLEYIIKINNQTPKLINIKAYNIQTSPNKKKD